MRWAVFYDFLKNINCKWLLSYDGKVDDIKVENNFPKIYDKHIYLKSGNSSFRRMKNKNSEIEESLYIKM